MATTKKPVAKKPVTKAKAVAKKPAVKKSALAAVKLPKTVPMKSFKVSPRDLPFLSTRITTQTIYWAVLLIFILLTQLWILNIQLDIINITDSITLQQ